MRLANLPAVLSLLHLAGLPALGGSECPDGRISHVFVDNHSIFELTAAERQSRIAPAYRLANALHMETRESVIRNMLLFRQDDCLDVELLAESERLLRGYDFLARVEIFPVRQPDGTYHVVVYTRDEWSTAVNLRLSYGDDRVRLRGVQLVESNLLGTGRTAGAYYRENEIGRDYGVVYANPRFLGPRWMLETLAGRTRVGPVTHQSLTRPFLGERGRWAIRQTYGRDERDFEYLIGPSLGATHLLLPVREAGADFAAVRRFGRTGRRTTLGAGLIYRSTRYPASASVLLVRDHDFDSAERADSGWTAAVRDRVEELRSVGFLLLAGQRRIHWVTRRSLDTLYGEEDVPLGVDVELAAAPPLPGAGREDDAFANVRLFAAAQPVGGLLVLTRLRGEGRRSPDTGGGDPGWVDLLAEAELLIYRQPDSWPDHTLVVGVAAAGGWQTRVPYQLTLGGPHAVRGYSTNEFPGGRRVVISLEDRIALGRPLRQAIGLGGTVFIDVGRNWAGDALFGVDSGWRAAAGFGLRAAFPAESRNVYRLDLALPIEAGAGLNAVRVIFSVGEPRGFRARLVDGRLARSLRSPATGEVLHFPGSGRRDLHRP